MAYKWGAILTTNYLGLSSKYIPSPALFFAQDLTPLLAEYEGPLAQPIIAAAGSDISFWFDEAFLGDHGGPGVVGSWESKGPTPALSHPPPTQ